MDFGLVILPPFASQRAGALFWFGQRPIYPAIWNQARRKDRRKLTGLLKFASEFDAIISRRWQRPAPGGNVVD
jgi:hypothetical protein